MERIEKLRELCFTSSRSNDKFYYLFYKEYKALFDLPEEDRYAKSFYRALTTLPAEISESELVVGKSVMALSDEEQVYWDKELLPYAQARAEKAGGGQDSHMAIDYELLLSKGIKGIIKSIDSLLRSCEKEKEAFYKSCKLCLEGVIQHSKKYSTLAQELSLKAKDQKTKDELLEISRTCQRVPASPAESFYEAVQSVHFISHCLSFAPYRLCHQQFQLGHPDRYLLSYYEKDLEKGTLTKEKAQEILDCLGIQINLRIPRGLSGGYMLGGRDEKGEVIANDLTDMCLQVIDDVRLVYPAVGLCYTDDMPDHLLEKACRLLLKGYSHPAIFNDDVITKGLIYYGVSKKEAHNYIHSTCVEITPVASSNVWVASPYTNMPKLLLEIMVCEYKSFEELLTKLFSVLDSKIKKHFEEQNSQRNIRVGNSINPLLSCFVNDCLEKGLDIEKGGAKYNWIMPSFVGMANLVDSLYAIKKLVFQDKKLSLTQFKSELDANFENNEALRLYIQNRIPKYGNDLDEIDKYFGMIIEHIAKECEKHHGELANSSLIPSVFCWIMHERFGRQTCATPDGRKAGFPLGDGSGPCQGRELNGPTASILSSTKWDHTKFIGGVAVNLKFSKSSLGENSSATLQSLIKTYIKRGGFELQINVTNNEILKKAKENPEEYRDLIVRIGGYSDYFVKLSPQMQEEVMQRTTHKL